MGCRHRARIQPLPTLGTTEDSASKPASFQVTARYNAISNALRTQVADEIKAHEVEIVSCQASIVSSKTLRPWICSTMKVSVDGNLHHVLLATERCDTGMSAVTQMGVGQRVFCHFPRFGTWIEYKCYNMLSYCESMRERAVVSGTRLKTIAAPMPCKVLTVLKKDGDQVKAGETVIVVESMKMEMNILASLGGVFFAMVKKGDAVNEGALLCRIE